MPSILSTYHHYGCLDKRLLFYSIALPYQASSVGAWFLSLHSSVTFDVLSQNENELTVIITRDWFSSSIYWSLVCLFGNADDAAFGDNTNIKEYLRASA
jgi:hypothetical protein